MCPGKAGHHLLVLVWIYFTFGGDGVLFVCGCRRKEPGTLGLLCESMASYMDEGGNISVMPVYGFINALDGNMIIWLFHILSVYFGL